VREDNNLQHNPYYFNLVENPDDNNALYYVYNNEYFENQRKNLNYEKIMNIYEEYIPDE